MSTAYNFLNRLAKSREAGRDRILDPGSGGTVQVSPTDDGVLVISSTGARTLQAASQLPVGTRVLVCVTVSGVTVNGTSIADGEVALFVVALDSSAASEWVILA